MSLAKSEDNFKKIKELVKKSDISLLDQEKLILLFAIADDHELDNILALFLEDSVWIQKINENYKIKQSVLASGNSALWRKIVEDEEVLLKGL